MRLCNRCNEEEIHEKGVCLDCLKEMGLADKKPVPKQKAYGKRQTSMRLSEHHRKLLKTMQAMRQCTQTDILSQAIELYYKKLKGEQV